MTSSRHAPVGSDAWWRAPQRRVSDLETEVRRLRSGIGSRGMRFASQGLEFTGTGGITGSEESPLDWEGPATLGGTVTIRGHQYRPTQTTYHSNTTSTPQAGTLVGVGIARPFPCEQAIFTVHGIASGIWAVDATEGWIWCEVETEKSPDVSSVPAPSQPDSMQVSWSFTLSNPGIQVNADLMNDGDFSVSESAISVVATWIGAAS